MVDFLIGCLVTIFVGMVVESLTSKWFEPKPLRHPSDIEREKRMKDAAAMSDKAFLRIAYGVMLLGAFFLFRGGH